MKKRTGWLVFSLLIPVLSALAQESISINCGGGEADAFVADRGCTDGNTAQSYATIAKIKTWPMALYQSYRVGSKLAYTFPELPNGQYRVRLHFAELRFDNPGDRVSSISIERVKVEPKLDIVSRAKGKNRALRLNYLVTVSDGNGLEIKAVGKNGKKAVINGIEIRPVTEPPPPGPSAPEGMVLIEKGRNTGTDPDFGHYDLSVDAFYMDTTEVTAAKWDEVRAWALLHGYSGITQCLRKGPDHPILTQDLPVIMKWCNARSEMEGRMPAYYTSPDMGTIFRTGDLYPADVGVDWKQGFRLPSKAEWEYAARGGLIGKRFPWGDTITHQQANYVSNATFPYDISATRGMHPDYGDGLSPYSQFDTNPVDAFPPNGYGLYGMTGNATEAIWEYYTTGGFILPVRRGGSGDLSAEFARCGAPEYGLCDEPDYSIRLVLPK